MTDLTIDAPSMKEQPDWANLHVLHRNLLRPRANFFNYDNEADALSYDITKAKSHRLSGTWRFHLANSPFGAPAGFEDPHFDSSKWGLIAVPGMWQLQGYGRGPHYTNVQFPFFVDPPFPPYDNNECGSYLTRFTVPRQLEGQQLRIRFEGVDSAFHIWINGRLIGYSQGSRNPSEFDVHEYVKGGVANVLAVRVYQFCDGSYIEDQDQWWLSGIFRDVFLLGFPVAARLEDFAVQTILDDQYKNATLKVQTEVSRPGRFHLRLLDALEKEVATASKDAANYGRQSVEFSLAVSDPEKWTAETPYLYHLVLAFDDTQFVAHRVGFRQVELKDGLIMVNGKAVIFKGANRHEHHPTSGRTVPYDFMKWDLLLMKKHNINAIRTCHQPSDPRLYDLADELGFWVMDEADLECHGFEAIEDAALKPHEKDLPFHERQLLTRGKAAEWISDDPEWQDAYVDRAEQLVHHDKLHPSVIIWSLGNEAFFGRNHIAMVDWIKSHDSTRLIHYEPDLEANCTDMHSRMYPTLDEIIAFAEDKRNVKPLVLCEYIHAMGTGPGNIKEYVDAFYRYPQLQGGWVWEWSNHGLITKTEQGDQYYGYGGDFGDVPNDGHFVMDGVVNSDHTPNSGLTEYKKALEPVQVISVLPNSVVVVNRFDFSTLDHLVCIWSFAAENGSKAKGGELNIPKGILPGTTTELVLPDVSCENTVEAFIDLSFRLREKTPWAEAGYELAWIQISRSNLAIGQIIEPVTQDSSDPKIEESATELKIRTDQSEWTIDVIRGKLTSWKKDGQEVIVQPLEPTFYRALTDNDAPYDGREWQDRRLDHASLHSRAVRWQNNGGSIIVEMDQKVAPPALSWSLNLKTTYVFDRSGTLRINIKGAPHGHNLPNTLPRIGVTLGVSKSFNCADWFGRGPGECYKDMKLSQRIGLHSVTNMGDLWTDPEFPQECSNRTDTRWLKLSNGQTTLTAQFYDYPKPEQRRLFDFMISYYDVKDIDGAKHPYELHEKRNEYVVLRLDAEHHGLGTGSCGPKTLDRYALKTSPFDFSLLLF